MFMPTHRVVVVIGTRPEAIKLAPVVRALKQYEPVLETVVVVTGQHRHMLDQVMNHYGIRPDHDLNLMRANQSLADLTSRVVAAMDTTLRKLRPMLVIVQGDTTTVSATALAAFYCGIPIGHVEAGLRSDNHHDPFPEEINRRLTSVLSDLHFAPTERAARRLEQEGTPAAQVWVTGNTVVDAITTEMRVPFDITQSALAALPLIDHRMIFVTAHRRESWGKPLEAICQALADIVETNPDVIVVYPVHPNPNVHDTVYRLLRHKPRIFLLEPLDYITNLHAMLTSYLILTDSGGIQEEAPSLHKPVLVLRRVTERPEACEIGAAKLVGTDRDIICQETRRLLNDPTAYQAMVAKPNPFGDGHAAERIATAIARWTRGHRPCLTAAEQFHTMASA